MRITVRLIVSLVFASSLVVAVSTYWQIGSERSRLLEDLERRSGILAETLQEIVAPALTAQDKKRLAKAVEKYGNRERMIGIAVFDPKGEALAFSPSLQTDLAGLKPLVAQALGQAGPASKPLKERYAYVVPIQPEGDVIGFLALVRDASFIRERLSQMARHNFFRLLIHAFLISLVSLLIIRWNILAPIDQMAAWMKQIRAACPICAASSRSRTSTFGPRA